ncbi:MAG: hypothetical protein LBN23_01965, partial [Paludibacter sp.]|nr:hypothetical protein [Paludibacter sp.]
KIKIDKNNFKIVFNKWTDIVMPSIAVNWDNVKKSGLLAGDFYLADLLSENNKTLKDKLFVLLQSNYYEIDRHLNEYEIFTSSKIEFKDNQKAHNEFWNKYERPPHEDYWDYIINRRDLLVPPDVRERKGSFFTPKIWVELSQKYLADALGENWQDEYYIWDCCAGTGNLLEGLTNKYRIFASTLDKQDVFVMLDRIKNGANLLESHAFQFDFLNDSFDKLPDSLQKIINDHEKRKKLVIYINPPYAEATNARTATGTGENKNKVATVHKTNELYKREIGNASNELFAQFFMRIYKEIPNANLASFSTLKYINAPNFVKFRNVFKAEYKNGFAVPANTFDNVKGDFPIGFLIWKFSKNKFPEKISVDIFNDNFAFISKKEFYSEPIKNINDWISSIHKSNDNVGTLYYRGNDFQNQKYIYISLQPSTAHDARFSFNVTNFIDGCIYFAVRHCITANWLNDRDQFLFPNKKWDKNLEFQNDCLAFTLFYGQNKISINDGVNHWIPFTEEQVNAAEAFESHFMSSFIAGKIKQNGYVNLFEQANEKNCIKREFSAKATAVFDAGHELWKYYHKQKNINVNANLYDIREYFQGRNDKGKMNNKSTDETYNTLIGNLRDKLKLLAKKIEPKVYEYEFLK